MRELVPDVFAVLARGMLERRLGRQQVAADHAVPVAETSVDVRRHVERVRVARRHALVLARDVEQVPLTARHVVGMHEVVHRAGVVGIPFVNPQQDRRGHVGIRRGRSRSLGTIARCASAKNAAASSSSGKARYRPSPMACLPAPDTEPVVLACGVCKERPRGCDVLPLALRGWVQCLRLLDFVPAALARFRSRACRPEWLEQGHRDAPVRHCALGIAGGCLLERLTSLRVGHVVQQREPVLEGSLTLRCAAHRKVHGPERLAILVPDVRGGDPDCCEPAGSCKCSDQPAINARPRSSRSKAPRPQSPR